MGGSAYVVDVDMDVRNAQVTLVRQATGADATVCLCLTSGTR